MWATNEIQRSEWNERHGRLRREVTVERGGSSRDTIEPWARARWTVKSVWATNEPRGYGRINGADGMSDPAAAIFSCAQPLSITITFCLS